MFIVDTQNSYILQSFIFQFQSSLKTTPLKFQTGRSHADIAYFPFKRWHIQSRPSIAVHVGEFPIQTWRFPLNITS